MIEVNVIDNKAFENGGGLYLYNMAINITRCVFRGNIAGYIPSEIPFSLILVFFITPKLYKFLNGSSENKRWWCLFFFPSARNLRTYSLGNEYRALYKFRDLFFTVFQVQP